MVHVVLLVLNTSASAISVICLWNYIHHISILCESISTCFIMGFPNFCVYLITKCAIVLSNFNYVNMSSFVLFDILIFCESISTFYTWISSLVLFDVLPQFMILCVYHITKFAILLSICLVCSFSTCFTLQYHHWCFLLFAIVLSNFNSVNMGSFVLFHISILCESISTCFTLQYQHWCFLMCFLNLWFYVYIISQNLQSNFLFAWYVNFPHVSHFNIITGAFCFLQFYFLISIPSIWVLLCCFISQFFVRIFPHVSHFNINTSAFWCASSIYDFMCISYHKIYNLTF